ncbi:MarR family winged helix-turn-helix transcriptional regulator [Pseudovibrio flavus]|uniref:MarR family winged helix-turn-helix transcriptional regulator n=1 Tax=Pseudovibrio flavus TaxID=2529854 RepID=UPI00211BF839|nr:MarR family winged helix-turn-helix transcriptional regulator [Pseudovibrio flavus]
MADQFEQISLFEEDPSFELENFLPLKIARIGKLVEQQLSEHLMSRHYIGIPEWLVLNTLTRSEGVSVKDLCSQLDLDTVAVSRAATKLTDYGYIEKATNQDDRRLIVLVTTAEGRTLSRQIECSLANLEKRLSRGISRHDWIRMGQLIAAFKQRP